MRSSLQTTPARVQALSVRPAPPSVHPAVTSGNAADRTCQLVLHHRRGSLIIPIAWHGVRSPVCPATPPVAAHRSGWHRDGGFPGLPTRAVTVSPATLAAVRCPPAPAAVRCAALCCRCHGNHRGSQTPGEEPRGARGAGDAVPPVQNAPTTSSWAWSVLRPWSLRELSRSEGEATV